MVSHLLLKSKKSCTNEAYLRGEEAKWKPVLDGAPSLGEKVQRCWLFFWGISADPLLSLFQLTHGTTWASCLAPSSLSYTGLPTPGPRGLSHHLGLGLDLPLSHFGDLNVEQVSLSPLCYTNGAEHGAVPSQLSSWTQLPPLAG